MSDRLKPHTIWLTLPPWNEPELSCMLSEGNGPDGDGSLERIVWASVDEMTDRCSSSAMDAKVWLSTWDASAWVGGPDMLAGKGRLYDKTARWPRDGCCMLSLAKR